jgi:hypothetical protein
MEFSDSTLRDARAIRTEYLRDFLISGWNAVLRVFQLRAHSIKRNYA